MPDPQPPSPDPDRPLGIPEIGAGAPDPSQCRAGRAAHGPDLALCFVRPIPACRFILRFAGNSFCRHPDAERIIARTRTRP